MDNQQILCFVHKNKKDKKKKHTNVDIIYSMACVKTSVWKMNIANA